MTLHNLKSRLEQTYQVLCYIDLADVNQQHSAAYKIFQQYHKDCFTPKERIVFYSAHRPSDRLLEHLQQAANLIDISSCFIMICGPHNVSEKLKTLSHDDNVMEYYPASIDSKLLMDDQLFSEDTICPLPWTHLEVRNQGKIYACCVSQKAFGNINQIGLQEAFDSQDIKNFRQQFLNNSRPAECNTCWRLEDRGLTSNRIRHLGLVKKDLFTKYLSNPKIVSLDLKPGNTCNFKCRICNPESSSQVAQEQSKYNNIPMKSHNWAEASTLAFDKIKKLLPEIENLELYGGEPFLIKPLNSLIKHAVSTGVASQMRLHYNSNGSIYPTELLKYWPYFKHVDIHFSIDNIGARFELERGGKWADVEKNVTQLVKLRLPNIKISV
jgi:radical SAM protein with 4Fe4S-binding SPASM domain